MGELRLCLEGKASGIAVHVRHLDIHQYQRRRVLGHSRQRFPTVACKDQGVVLFKDLPHGVEVQRFIVNHQNWVDRHG
ncbi:hypothetical protein D3C85_1871230 [compost metagenome]